MVENERGITSRPRVHKCMRCSEEFDCEHGPNCTADYSVLPNVINPDGRGFTEHCPSTPDWNWIRAYGERMRASPSDAEQLAELRRLGQTSLDLLNDVYNSRASQRFSSIGLSRIQSHMQELRNLLAKPGERE